METKTKKKQYVKLGFNKEETIDLVKNMNFLLANYHVFYQKLRNYHWNVTGGDFFDLHEKFEELYTETVINIDEIAERIRVYGQTPMSTLKEYLKNSDIQETGTDLSDTEMLAEVIQDIEIIDSHLINVVDIASEIGDVASVDLINKMIKTIEKHHWMLSAFANK